MKIFKISLLLILLFLVLPVEANCSKYCKNYDKTLKFIEYYDKQIFYRPILFNILNLTPEQSKKILKIQEENTQNFKNLYESYSKKSYELAVLCKANATHNQLKEQSKYIKSTKKELRKLKKSETHCIRTILNHSQRSKYAMVNKFEKEDLKNFINPKDYYKSNPKMTRFGE